MELDEFGYYEKIDSSCSEKLARASVVVLKEFEKEIRFTVEEEVLKIPDYIDVKFDEVLRQYSKKNQRVSIKKLLKVGIIVLIVTASASIVLSSNVEAFRFRFFNFITEVNDDYFALIPNDENNSLEITYLPKGFTQDSVNRKQNVTTYKYTNVESDIIVFEQLPAGGTMQYIDNSNASIIMLKGIYQCYCVEDTAAEWITLFWLQNDFVITLAGNVSKGELIKVAESVK